MAKRDKELTLPMPSTDVLEFLRDHVEKQFDKWHKRDGEQRDTTLEVDAWLNEVEKQVYTKLGWKVCFVCKGNRTRIYCGNHDRCPQCDATGFTETDCGYGRTDDD